MRGELGRENLKKKLALVSAVKKRKALQIVLSAESKRDFTLGVSHNIFNGYNASSSTCYSIVQVRNFSFYVDVFQVDLVVEFVKTFVA